MAHHVIETNKICKYQDLESHAFVNQYELLSNLGEGMHGKVMLARVNATGERCAIKIMRRNDPNNRRLPKSTHLDVPPMTAQQETEYKIRREIAVMKKCTHQNLVQLLEVIDDPDSKKIYLVMENLEGGEVKWRSKTHNKPVLKLSQVQRIMRDVTLGLEYLHHQGIIHRDIKPANLLWTADRQSVKICDFGVSHVMAQQDPTNFDEADLTKTAGSPAFFAPEICHIPKFSFDEIPSSAPHRQGSQTSISPASPSSPENLPITKQIDIWALGVTFYCLLFGVPPWQGNTEFLMFRAICNDDFDVPETMACDCIPTGGKERSPEGEQLGWCIVGLLEGLLEKDQDKRITLSEIKRIPWIQNGVRDPERWLRETTPTTQTKVIITEEDTKRAIKPALFSYATDLIFRLIKRVPIPSGSRMGAKSTAVRETKTSVASGTSKRFSQSQSLGRARSSRTKAVVGNQLKRFTFSNASPTRSNTVPGSKERRRNSSSVGNSAQHTQSFSDPSSHIDRRRDSVPSKSDRRSIAVCAPDSTTQRRPSESLQLPFPASGRGFFFGGSTTSISPTPSPTTPDGQQVTGSKLRQRLSQVIRRNSVKKVVGKARRLRSNRTDDEPSPRGRTSAETLDVLRQSEDLGLTPAMRASSWGSPGIGSPNVMDDDDGHASLDLTGSEAGGGMQDFNKSVVRFGAGGYIDSPTPSTPASSIFQPLSTPGASGSGTASAVMTHSDSSSNSTATATIPVQPHPDAAHYPPRVTSPLAHAYDSGEEGEDDLSSDVFIDDPDSSDDEVLELQTRRPSAVLSRSANASPLQQPSSI